MASDFSHFSHRESKANKELQSLLADALTSESLVILTGLGSSRCVSGAPSMDDLWDAMATSTGPKKFEAIRKRTGYEWIGDRGNFEYLLSRCNQGGRVRWKIKNQGFNLQKNSGLNLEHAYITDPDVMKSFYYLMQIAHLFSQMFEMGSVLRRLAQDYATTPVGLFGSLKNIAKRLLECFRYFCLTDEDFQAYPGQVRLCDPGG